MSGGFSSRVTSEENDFTLPVSIRGQLLNAKKIIIILCLKGIIINFSPHLFSLIEE